MWKAYQSIIHQYPRISLQEERRLIRQAKKGSKSAADELVLRYIGFIIVRIHKRAFPAYVKRFGEDLLSQAIPIIKVSSSPFDFHPIFGNESTGLSLTL